MREKRMNVNVSMVKMINDFMRINIIADHFITYVWLNMSMYDACVFV